MPPVVRSTALLTNHYELTRLQAALAGGTAHRRSVFPLAEGLGLHRQHLGRAEGEAHFSNSPVLIVEATSAEAVVLETVLPHDGPRRHQMSRGEPETPTVFEGEAP